VKKNKNSIEFGKGLFLVLLALLGFLGFSCDTLKKDSAETALNFLRLDTAIMQAKTKQEIGEIFKKYPDYTKSLYRAMPDDTALISHVFYLSQHPDTKKFYEETIAGFGDLNLLKKQFSEAFSKINEDFPNFKSPKIYITFTGLENDLYVSDSLLIISLESFLGPKATYRPDQPLYLLKRYDKPYIVPSIIRLMADSYNKTNTQDQSMLADMVYIGKSLEFTKNALPDCPDSLIMGYSEKQLTDTWNAQDLVWGHMIDKQLLYEKNAFKKEKYLGERPGVPEIGPSCPGRIGQWLGWRIVKKYLAENKSKKLTDLMAEVSAEEILKKSAYRGQLED
jgi:hypothetical protein